MKGLNLYQCTLLSQFPHYTPHHHPPAPSTGQVQGAQEAGTAPQANSQDTSSMDMVTFTALKDSCKDSFDSEYRMFVENMLANMSQLDTKLHQNMKEMVENKKRIAGD